MIRDSSIIKYIKIVKGEYVRKLKVEAALHFEELYRKVKETINPLQGHDIDIIILSSKDFSQKRIVRSDQELYDAISQLDITPDSLRVSYEYVDLQNEKIREIQEGDGEVKKGEGDERDGEEEVGGEEILRNMVEEKQPKDRHYEGIEGFKVKRSRHVKENIGGMLSKDESIFKNCGKLLERPRHLGSKPNSIPNHVQNIIQDAKKKKVGKMIMKDVIKSIFSEFPQLEDNFVLQEYVFSKSQDEILNVLRKNALNQMSEVDKVTFQEKAKNRVSNRAIEKLQKLKEKLNQKNYVNRESKNSDPLKIDLPQLSEVCSIKIPIEEPIHQKDFSFTQVQEETSFPGISFKSAGMPDSQAEEWETIVQDKDHPSSSLIADQTFSEESCEEWTIL